MTNPRLISGQTVATMGLRAAGLLLGAAVTIVIARVLSPERFGEFAFVLSVATIASIPPAIGLRQTLTRQTAYSVAQDDRASLPGLWLWAMQWAALAVLLVSTSLAIWVVLWVDAPDLRRNLLIGLCILILLPAPQIFGGILHGLGRINLSLIPEAVLRPVIMLAIVAGLVTIIGQGAVTVPMLLVGLACAIAIDALVGAALFRRITGFRIAKAMASERVSNGPALRWSALSFGAITGVHVINSNLDVVMIGLLAGDLQTGLYRAASVVSDLVVFGLGVVNFVILPRVAGLHAVGDRQALQTLVTASTRIITALALGGFVLIAGFGSVLLALLYGDGFSEGYSVLLILALGQLANALFGPVALLLNMTGNEKLTLIGVSLSVVINAGLNVLLIPRFGIEGAATATAATLIIWNLMLAVLLKRRVGYHSTILGPRLPL